MDPEYGSYAVYAHVMNIQGAGFKTLEAGQKVSFDITESPKGAAAVNIVVVA